MDEKISGISCEVKHCKYHDQSNCCHAGHIVVGNQSAKDTDETICETFECCSDDNCCQ